MYAWIELLAFVIVLTALTPVLGGYLAGVFGDGPHPVRRALGGVENAIYRICRIDPSVEMTWKTYLAALVVFTSVSAAALFVLLLTQHELPWNPQHLADLPPLLALNVAISYATTTDWQAFSPETTVSPLTQMVGFAWQGFVGAAAGLAVAIAMIRGFVRSSATTLGNFWVDLTRSLLYVLLPLCVVGSLLLVWQGTPQNFDAYRSVKTLEGATQTIISGPIASQESIKQFGVNGGGYVTANSAAPVENPTPLTDFFYLIVMVAIGAALTNTFGRLIGNVRQGWTLYGVMLGMCVLAFAGVWGAEHAGNPLIHHLGAAGPNLEGKEQRFGDATSALSVAVVSAGSDGAANIAYDSLMPLSTLIVLINMQIGGVMFGGVGCGLCGMILLVVLTVFVAGLMVGRTPEYLGKKIERREITLAMLAALVPAVTTLIPTAIGLIPGLSVVGNGGPHGFTEVLYDFSSLSSINGSSMGGLGVTSNFYLVASMVLFTLGRFGPLILALALAGGLVTKHRQAHTHGTIDTATPLFGILIAGAAILVAALTYLPANALGPVAEALLLHHGATF